MTPNEKAATFIGWTGQCDRKNCNHEDSHWRPRYKGMNISGILYEVEHIDNMPLLAPDMSKPENYMRAIRAYYLAGDTEQEKERRYYEAEAALGQMIVRDEGALMVTYLASCYDTEHLAEEDKHGSDA